MAGSFTPIDLSKLPKPSVVEIIDYEAILVDMIVDLQKREPSFTALVESDPAYKVLEVCACREMLLRQRANDSASAVMLAYAEKEDLDNIGANYDCARLTIQHEDNTTIPPAPAVMEDDDPYRARIQLSMQGFSCAGPMGAYQYFAKSASGDVLDVSVTTPSGGTVLVSILSRTGNGAAPDATIQAVRLVLNADSVRPLCDTVRVESAQIVEYSISAVLTLLNGADATTVLANANASGAGYALARHKNGRPVSLAGWYGALCVAGVEDVAFQAPGLVANLMISPIQASYCTSLSVTIGGSSD
ncbi:baseplate assembly protein [Burkholderia alba]|uniref:baseplate assembly protein n=1 Tax=Burkholderia alba TaxID=2683677 RepID=UPI002B052800|nr:baseplate J/gp47 family protein [Burkholderia alba]